MLSVCTWILNDLHSASAYVFLKTGGGLCGGCDFFYFLKLPLPNGEGLKSFCWKGFGGFSSS